MSKGKNLGRPKLADEDKAKPNDRLKCDVCGGTFLRNSRTRHNRTKVHKIYENMNNTMRDMLLQDSKNKGKKKLTLNEYIESSKNKENIKKILQPVPKKKIKNLDSDDEESENADMVGGYDNSSDENPIHRAIRLNNEQKIPYKYNNYIAEHFGTILLYPADVKFLNSNVSHNEKIHLINELAQKQGKKYYDDIDNVDPNDIWNGNAEEIKAKIRKLGKF